MFYLNDYGRLVVDIDDPDDRVIDFNGEDVPIDEIQALVNAHFGYIHVHNYLNDAFFVMGEHIIKKHGEWVKSKLESLA